MSSFSSDCECSICYDAITAETGTVKLGGCAHLYHFRCISSWFASQAVSTCPLCRKEMPELADFAPPAEGEEEEDDDEEDEDDEDEDEEEEFIRISRASIDDLLVAQGSRRSDGSIDTLAMAEGHSSEDTPTFDEEGYTIVARMEMDILFQVTGSRPLTDEQWEVLVAEFPLPMPPPSLQEVGLESFAAAAASSAAAAASYAAEDEDEESVAPSPSPTPSLSITWHLQDGGRWVRQVLNPEEQTSVSVTTTGWAEPVPVSAEVAEQRAVAAAESLQEAWRCYKVRKEAKDAMLVGRILMGMRSV